MRWVIVLPLPGLLGLLISLEAKSRAFREGVDKLRNPVESRRLFREAADGFDELRQHGCQSPALYLRLGNAEALAGHWPRAIWAYHGGLAMDPNHATLREHLAYARSLVNYPTGGRGRVRRARRSGWRRRPAGKRGWR